MSNLSSNVRDAQCSSSDFSLILHTLLWWLCSAMGAFYGQARLYPPLNAVLEACKGQRASEIAYSRQLVPLNGRIRQ